MPTPLSDPSPTLYIVLGAIAVVLGAIAARRQKRSNVIAFGVAAAVLLALFLIDRFFESPREQVVRSIKEMELATQNKRNEDVFKHISDSFKYKSLDKKGFQDATRFADANPDWQGIKVIDLKRDGFTLKDDTTAEQKFEVQPLRLPGTEYRYDCIATFKKEGDEWKLTGFKLMKDGQEVSPPGL